jgi:leucyl aminopeptidase
MNVTFLESAQAEVADLFVIVACKFGGSEFVEGKLTLLLDKASIKQLVPSEDDLKYNCIKKFNVVSKAGKLTEIIIAGAGERGTATRTSAEKLGGFVYERVTSKDAKVCIFNNIESELNQAAAYLASGIELKSWSFDKYKSEKDKAKINAIECVTNFMELNTNLYESLTAIKNGVFAAREMVTEPANVMTPDGMLGVAMELKKLGVKVSVLERKDMEKLKMNAILGVGKGSENPTYVISMEYCSDRKLDKIVLIGKGLTFDSGGLSIKPANRMGEMKGDMAGAAAVVGTIKALALQKATANVVGVIGVAENMPSGGAQRPGDVVVAMSGKSIEIDNTDAEGRLVLADVLWYAKEKFGPKVMIDLATLTGAIEVALGHEFAGLFSNSDALVVALEKAGKTVGEKLWRLPLHASFKDDIKSNIADIKNVGSGRGAGSITAAMFLQEFVPDTIEWAHLDIAATEWDSKPRALSQKGATGFGVRLLCDYVTKHYSSEG